MRSSWLLLISCYVLLGVILSSSCLSSVSAQGYFKPANADPKKTITPVCFVQVSFNKVSKVDGVEQLFDADFYMQLFWLDLGIQDFLLSSNNTSPNNNNGTGLFYAIANQNFEFSPRMAGYYDPYIEFVNGDGDIVEQGTYYTVNTPPFVNDSMLADLGIPSTGRTRADLRWTVKDFRYIGSFTTPLALQKFPYDHQYVQIVIESQWADQTQLTLVYTNISKEAVDRIKPDPNTTQIVGWEVEGVQVIRTYHNYNLFPGGNYSRLVVAMKMARQPDYYVSKIVVGVVLLVLMCICVYSLAVDEADRQMGTLQVFAGIVTFLFVASADVPKIPYTTKLDKFFLMSFGFVACMLLLHAILYFFRHDEGRSEEPETASPSSPRIDESSINVDVPRMGSLRSEASTSSIVWKKVNKKWNYSSIWRKADSILVALLFIGYAIACAVILGADRSDSIGIDLYTNSRLDPLWPTLAEQAAFNN